MAANDTQYPMFILTNGYIIKFEEARFFGDDNLYLEGYLESDSGEAMGITRKKLYNPQTDDNGLFYEMLAGKVISEAMEDGDLPIPTNIASTIPSGNPPTPPEPETTEPEFENATPYPMWVLADGNVISIKRKGPSKNAIATKDGVVTFEFSNWLASAPNIDLANEAALSLETVIVRETPPPPTPPLPHQHQNLIFLKVLL